MNKTEDVQQDAISEERIVFEPIWGVKVELINPIRFSESYSQGFMRLHMDSPDAIKYDGKQLSIRSVPGGIIHNFPSINLVTWEVYYIPIPPAAKMKGKAYSFHPYHHPLGTEHSAYAGYFEDVDGKCLAFLDLDGEVTYMAELE